MSDEAPPEPEKTGVDPTQKDEQLTILPAADNKAYVSMSATLAGFVGTGIRGSSIPILLTYERDAEARFTNVDTERRQALLELKEMTAAYHGQANLVTQLSERMRAGNLGSIGQNVMITIGAIMLGAGIPELIRNDIPLGLTLAIVGAVLLLAGWILGFFDQRRKTSTLP
jgi:hypothetical protein